MGSSLSTTGRSPPISQEKLLTALTALMDALPAMNTTPTQLKSKISTYLEILSLWWTEEELSSAIQSGLKTQWKWFPTIMEIEQECRKVAHQNWEKAQSQVQALIPEEFQPTPGEREKNLKLLADLKSHFEPNRASETPKRERPTITDAEARKGLDRLAQEWDKNRG